MIIRRMPGPSLLRKATGGAGLPALAEELRRFCDDVDRLIDECRIDGSQSEKLEELRRARAVVEQVLLLLSAR